MSGSPVSQETKFALGESVLVHVDEVNSPTGWWRAKVTEITPCAYNKDTHYYSVEIIGKPDGSGIPTGAQKVPGVNFTVYTDSPEVRRLAGWVVRNQEASQKAQRASRVKIGLLKSILTGQPDPIGRLKEMFRAVLREEIPKLVRAELQAASQESSVS